MNTISRRSWFRSAAGTLLAATATLLLPSEDRSASACVFRWYRIAPGPPQFEPRTILTIGKGYAYKGCRCAGSSPRFLVIDRTA